MKNILFLTTAETDLLTLSSVLRQDEFENVTVTARNILRLESATEFLSRNLDDTDVVLLRVVGGAEYFREGLNTIEDELSENKFRLIAVSASNQTCPELQGLSTEEAGVVNYFENALQEGGQANFRNIIEYLSTGGSPPEIHHPAKYDASSEGPDDVALLYYRARELSGDTNHITALTEQLQSSGLSVKKVYVPGITQQTVMDEVVDQHLTDSDGDPLVSCVISLLGFACSKPGNHWKGFDDLNVPWFQLLVSSEKKEAWRSSSDGLTSSDLSMKIILPEIDGRVAGPPIAFRSNQDFYRTINSTITKYTPHPSGIQRATDLIDHWMALKEKANEHKKIAIVLGNHPTGRARIGNGVGLDTPASLLNLLTVMKEAGYRTETLPDDPGRFMDKLIQNGSYGHDDETPPAKPVDTVGYELYRDWLSQLPEANRDQLLESWDDPSQAPRGSGGFPVPGLRMGNVFVGIQPPRGFEEQTEAVYHDPDLPPPHSYLAFYRWITRGFEADAIVHLGKHGTLEWLPGRSTALGRKDWPALLLDECPLVYPFIINDPGEGSQAKRRNSAVIVDHMVAPQRDTNLPPELENIRDKYVENNGGSGDNGKESPGTEVAVNDELESMGQEEIQRLIDDVSDSRTRSGLHVLGELPEGEKAIDLLECLWPEEEASPGRDRLKQLLNRDELPSNPTIDRLIKHLKSLDREIITVLEALDGDYVQAGPSGAPTDGRPDLLPTGRNFYSRDARSMPTPEAWNVGRRLAEDLVDRHRNRCDSFPTKIGMVLWGTSNMRTGGEDVAQVLALMGVKPCWTDSGRVDGVERISESSLNRPRIDPLVRISGFFRDAFPNLVNLINDGVRCALEAPSEQFPNFVREHESESAGVDPRVFGCRSDNYGAGLLPLMETGEWEYKADLAEAFLEWGHHAYDGEGNPTPRRDELERQLANVEAVTQNRDNREHDLFDSDDYFQFQGGMIASATVLGDDSPESYFTDTSQGSVEVRTLSEEADRVYYSRVTHPVWLEGMRDHGYKGAFEMAATLDYVFGYDATTDAVPDGYYEGMAESFLFDERNREFLEENNQWSIQEIGERLLEANERDLWSEASDETINEIKESLRESEPAREEYQNE